MSLYAMYQPRKLPLAANGPQRHETHSTQKYFKEVAMGEAELAAAVERLMGRVDYYLHCELDEDYEHDRPAIARQQLEACLKQELQRAGAIGMVTAIARPAVASVIGTDDQVA